MPTRFPGRTRAIASAAALCCSLYIAAPAGAQSSGPAAGAGPSPDAITLPTVNVETAAPTELQTRQLPSGTALGLPH